ncbi:MAG: hypothetical protein ABIU10_00645 [Sphingomicrobium sp.]
MTRGRQRSLEVGFANALHSHYAASGGHADCYAADVPAPVSLADFVYAFYTSPLFRLERWILAVVLGKPSTDAEAKAVAAGDAPFDRHGAKGCDTAVFAAWTVEARTDDQLLTCDYQGRTRSWFMVQPGEPTRVYFGTAIAASRGGRIPFAFRALMPFHRLYSRALLWSAVRALRATL